MQNNKITNEGATAIAQALRLNKSLRELNLLAQQQAAFGEPCLQQFIDMFENNVTLTKIIWRLDSRKSFAINKLIVRNNTIKKWVLEGKSVQDIYPKGANIPIESLKETLLQNGGRSSVIVLEEDGAEEEQQNLQEDVAEEGLGDCPSGANHAAKTIFNEFKAKVEDKWAQLSKKRKRMNEKF